MIIKEVKEYSKRQRINLNKSDNIPTGSEVVIIPKKEYDNIKKQLDTIPAKDKELELYQKQENNLKQIIEDVTNPIYENHQKQLTIKDNELKQLKHELRELQALTYQYNLSIMGLNVIDILIFRKHKLLVKKFTEDNVVPSDPIFIDSKK